MGFLSLLKGGENFNISAFLPHTTKIRHMEKCTGHTKKKLYNEEIGQFHKVLSGNATFRGNALSGNTMF